MARLSLWKNAKTKDFTFQDRIIREQFYVGSVGIYIHKYLGIIDQGLTEDASQPTKAQTDDWGVTTIQDMTWMENRNRDYADNTVELRGHFNNTDTDFELLQFNLGIADGTKFITFHLNDMIDKIGRKLMSGDVIELPNMRDDALLDEGEAINQWYVITDASWPSEGFSSTWYPHLWRVKAKPMTDSPEFNDITKNDDGSSDPLRDLLSTYNQDLEINKKVTEQAAIDVPRRNLDASTIYVVEGEENQNYPWIFAGDDVPPNNSKPAESGTRYPDQPSIGEYFLRTDYEPSRLFKYSSAGWEFVEIDYRTTWVQAHRILESHINNDNTFEEDGKQVPEKQSITKAIKPKPDL